MKKILKIKIGLLVLLFVSQLSFIFADKETVSDAGRHFILTLPNYKDITLYDSWIEQVKPAGVMLTEFHMQDRTKTKQLCKQLQEKAKSLDIHPLMVCVDFEGGIVSRGADINGFVSVPSPYKLGLLGKSDCFLAGKIIGHQLADVGINVDFAPSLDLFDAENYILATRCFSSDPQIVEDCSLSFINGLLSEGVLPVIKHFPGLMAGKSDTHTDNVQIKLSQNEFETNVSPFRKILDAKLDLAVMVSHAKYPQFGDEPASANEKVVNWIKGYNNNALLISDDIAMKSFHRASDDSSKLECICQTSQKSIQNGFDLLIFSATPEDQIQLVKKLDQASINNKFDVRSKIKNICQKLDTIEKSNMNEGKLSQELAKKAIQDDISEIPETNKILFLSVDLNKIRPATNFQSISDKDGTKNKTLLASLFEAQKYNVSEFVLDPMSENSSEELRNITYKSAFQNSDNIIVQTFFYGGGIWNKNQKVWLEQLKHYYKKLTIISLGHPYEKSIIPEAQTVSLGSFHASLIEAAFDKLKKKLC